MKHTKHMKFGAEKAREGEGAMARITALINQKGGVAKTTTAHALAVGQPVDAAYATRLQREYPQLQRYTLHVPTYTQSAEGNGSAQLWIVDPHGNLVLRYDPQVKGKDVLTDLRHLLKLSNIG